MQLNLLLVAAGTAVNRHQFSPLHIKLLFLVHHPLVMTVAAQELSFVFLLQGRLAKGDYLGHSQVARRYSNVRRTAVSQELKRLRRAPALMVTENSRSARQIFFICAGLCQRPAPRPAR